MILRISGQLSSLRRSILISILQDYNRQWTILESRKRSASRSKYLVTFIFMYLFLHREMNEFEKKGLDPDVVELRFKHYQNRLIDTLNRVIEQRRQIKMEQARQLNRANMGGQATPRSPNDNRIQKNQNTSMSVSSPVPQIKKGQSRL